MSILRIGPVARAVIFLSCMWNAQSHAQWVQVNYGLNGTVLRKDDVVIVAPITDCVNVHSGPSVSDSIIECEPAGAIGQIQSVSAPDEHGSSNLTFWSVRYLDGTGGWTAGKYLVHPTPSVTSFITSGTNVFVSTPGDGIFLSTNGGMNWTPVNEGLLLHTNHVSALAAFGTNLFAGTYGGAFRSTNNGTSWASIGLTDSNIVFLAASRTCLFTRTGNGAMLRSTNNGDGWESTTCPGSLAIIDSNLFAQHSNGQIDCSTDNGTTWTEFLPPPRQGVYPSYYRNFCASGKYLFWKFYVEDCCPPPFASLHRVSTIDTTGQMTFPPGFGPYGDYMGEYVSTFATNVLLGTGDGATLFSTNSGDDWKVLSVPSGISSPANPVLFVTLGTDLFVGGTSAAGIWKNSISDALPIQLASFSASTLNSSGVTLSWNTFSETNNYGFHVQRNGVDITFVPGHGTTIQQHTYLYTDNPSPGHYAYRLKQVDLDGTATLSGNVVVDMIAPAKFTLEQNYPNPFNPATTIRYGLPARSHVTMIVFNTLGQQVAELVNGEVDAGIHDVEFDGSRLASGVYFYRLVAGEHVDSKKLLLMK
jgi:hypothetical protein